MNDDYSVNSWRKSSPDENAEDIFGPDYFMAGSFDQKNLKDAKKRIKTNNTINSHQADSKFKPATLFHNMSIQSIVGSSKK